MPEEQSVRARDGTADPQGGGNPLRSGMPFLTLPPQPTATVLSIHQKTLRFLLLKATHQPIREGNACLKSKASAPGMARPIRREAGILCDRACLS